MPIKISLFEFGIVPKKEKPLVSTSKVRVKQEKSGTGEELRWPLKVVTSV